MRTSFNIPTTQSNFQIHKLRKRTKVLPSLRKDTKNSNKNWVYSLIKNYYLSEIERQIQSISLHLPTQIRAKKNPIPIKSSRQVFSKLKNKLSYRWNIRQFYQYLARSHDAAVPIDAAAFHQTPNAPSQGGKKRFISLLSLDPCMLLQ